MARKKNSLSLVIDKSDYGIVEDSINRDYDLASKLKGKKDHAGAKYHETAAVGKRDLAFDLGLKCVCIQYEKLRTWDAPMKNPTRKCACAMSVGKARQRSETQTKELRRAGNVVSIV